MDDAKIQELLSDLPPKVLRSKLEPFSKLIHEMQRRGFTYRSMAQVLTEKCQVSVAPGTVHDFLRVRSKAKAKIAKKEPETIPSQTVTVKTYTPEPSKRLNYEEGRKRIAALKNQPVPEPEKPIFTYNDEPLKLIPTKNKTE